ncbi:MAG: hypothetical protein ACI37R_07305 [Candidatus Avigastranaerophilus sp.]
MLIDFLECKIENEFWNLYTNADLWKSLTEEEKQQSLKPYERYISNHKYRCKGDIINIKDYSSLALLDTYKIN